MLDTMFHIFPGISKYFNSKIYPISYGNRNRSQTEIVGDVSNNIYEPDTYKIQLQNRFHAAQESKRRKRTGPLRIRGESF